MSIPVRVDPKIRPHAALRRRDITSDHPLYDYVCPVCDEQIRNGPIALVFIGRDTDRTDGRGWTAASVVVHDECADQPEEGAPDPLAAAEQRGRVLGHQEGAKEAIEALRDDERYRHWWTLMQPDHPEYGYWQIGRLHLADYLAASLTTPEATK